MVKRKYSIVCKKKNEDLLDTFSPLKVGQITPTSNKPRENVFECYRPRKEQCLDYKISQTFANFQKGDFKVNFKETCATYDPLPPEACKNVRKKVKRFHGGPPQWEFLDEIWLKQKEVFQKKAITKLRQATTEKSKIRRKRKIKEHEIVQSLIGPEWFMELSPNQLKAIDELQRAVNKDLTEGNVINTQEIMATLGLVLRPNQRHIQIALKQSCRSAIEFLLVLYQILDPNRENYSLNDRLILSAVVHLAITDTLKELHVRIPSPPNQPSCKIKEIVQKEHKQRYKSPYLQPQTFDPPRPKFSGIYKNKHIQWPESIYFAYLPTLEIERKQFKIFEYDKNKSSEQEKERWREYNAVQNFYDILPGAINTPVLLPASKMKICWNILNKKLEDKTSIIHLIKVEEADNEECCHCLELKSKKRADSLAKRSICDKGATEFIEKKLPCEQCLEKQLLRNSIKVFGGFANMTCPCDHIPVIQGTCLIQPCDCFIRYRNKVAIARAGQCLINSGTKHVISGVTMSKFGPVYNFAATLGDADCKCHIKQEIKVWKDKEKLKLLRSTTKFGIGGIHMTKDGPVHILTNVVARKACKCIEKYRNLLIVSEIQHQLKQNPASFVNSGIINTQKFGPIYLFSGAVENKNEIYESSAGFCECLVTKPKCLYTCEQFADYQDVLNDKNCEKDDFKTCNDVGNTRQNLDSKSITTNSSLCSCISPCEIPKSQSSSSFLCESCIKQSQKAEKKYNQDLCKICKERENNRDKYCGVIKSDQSSETTVSNPCKCKCKEALSKFMQEKCQCEDCLSQIRRDYATYISGGMKVTPSGTAFNLVQGIHQPQCSCMYDHLKQIEKVEEYKSRAILRYKTMHHSDKYSISGITMTKNGPVYNISGLIPPVECDCAVQLRKKQEEDKKLKRMPKEPNTGRIKFNVVGVKELSKENVYILANAVDTEECDCMKILRKFEEAHSNCVDEFDKFMEKIKEQKQCENVDSPEQDYPEERRETNLEFLASDPKIIENHESNQAQDVVIETDKNISKSSTGKSELPNTPKSASDSWGSTESCCCDKHSNTHDSFMDKNEEESSSTEDNLESETESDSESEEFNPCTILESDKITPINLKEKSISGCFMSKRYVIFKKIPKDKTEQEKILKHILEGMSEDGFPLAKLPQVYKLPIFKLWWDMRSGVYWTQADRQQYVKKSIEYWKHTDFCYKEPEIDQLPFTKSDLKRLTWSHAEMIRYVTKEYTNNYYRKIKQVTIATGREFFAPTFDYQFPTPTWRDCAFAYIPTKEEAVFPYKIYQLHDAKNVPNNKRLQCYC